MYVYIGRIRDFPTDHVRFVIQFSRIHNERNPKPIYHAKHIHTNARTERGRETGTNTNTKTLKDDS